MKRTRPTFAALLTGFADNGTVEGEPEFVLPEDLSVLNDDDLAGLHEQAVGHFDALYGDGSSLSDDDLSALASLTDAIEALGTEVARRTEASAARAASAAELATRVHTEERSETIEDVEDTTETTTEDGEDSTDEPVADAAPVAQGIAASARGTGPTRINLSGIARRQTASPGRTPAAAATTMRDVVLAAGDGNQFVAGTGLDWSDLGRQVDRRLQSFGATQYANAAAAGRHMREQHSLAVLRKPIPEDMMVQSNDPEHVDAVFRRAVDESRLPGGSLVAAGGWCAPSEILYDLVELESRDGLLSIPEVGIARGGIQFTTGPSFADIYANTGFGPITEANAVDGKYAVNSSGAAIVGPKPCYYVDCPDFTEERLDLVGLCISAGLLQQRGYPEVIARTLRGALVAHDHKMSVYAIDAMITGSTAVTMTAAQVGAAAPLLDAIEKQTEHYRYLQRMSRNTTLEAVFPYWVHGVVRSDLARRQGIAMLDVSDAQINAWFASRGVSPQFVYDWQPLTGGAASFLTWPSTVSFLLYAAGTWVRGTSDVITLDTIYDSQNLVENDYTALFTEEGFLMAKRGFDSRVVTVALCASGETGGGVGIACNGTSL